MKKIYLLLLLGLGLNSYAQTPLTATYDFSIGYERQSTDKQYEFINSYPSVPLELLTFSLTGLASNVVKIKSSDNIGNNYINDTYGCCYRMPNSPQPTFLHYKNIPAGNHQGSFVDFGLVISLFNHNGHPRLDIDRGDHNFEFYQFINPGKNNHNTLVDTYMGYFYVHSFKPNVFIHFPVNRNPATGTKTICANEQFGVNAYPEGFPPEIYNWQYSLDNKATWLDVPQEFHKANPNFTISDLLENNHLNYLDKTIYFRMGYDSMVFAEGIEFPLIYSSCAPLVNNVEYLPPLCYGDNVRDVTVTFDRNLYPGEELHDFQLKAVNTNTNLPDTTPPIVYPFFVEGDSKNGLITKFDEKSPGIYSYSMSNFRGLNPNATYQIRYQAFENSKNKGLAISEEDKNILYTEPLPLKFEIKKADNPVCADDFVEVAISVSGGTGDYKFYVDGNEKTNPKPIKESDGYYHILGIVPTSTNSIKVTDANSCIEKTL